MRSKILNILRERAPEPVSGEELAGCLGVSRTAIWKNIQALKEEGYKITAFTKKGYVLEDIPDKLLPVEIARKLKTKWLGHELHYVDSTGSTNAMCKNYANSGCADGTVCVAEEQTGGRGRLSRGWFSPAGKGLWFSLVLEPPFLPEEAPKCTLMAAVAVVKAVNSYKGVKAAIKWPNDILLDGKKLVGILTEMSAEFGHINYVVIGTGINVCVPRDMVPPELRESAISLADKAEEPINRVELLAKVLDNLEELYEIVLKQGFKPILAMWRTYSTTLGKMVKVIAPDSTYIGKALDINEEGILLVQKADGTIAEVLAGDVSIRAAHGKGSKY